MCGDNLAACAALMPKLRGRVRLVYMDPPFDMGRDFCARVRLTSGRVLNVPAYADTWGKDEGSFAHQLWLRLCMARDMLTADGSIVLHGNDHSAPLLRALLDDVFGRERFLNQIIWHYTGGGRNRRAFSNKHDVLFWYAKGPRHVFNIDAVRQPYKASSGYARSGIVAASGKRYLPHPQGTPVDDVWDIPMVNPMADERTGYPTQKPVELLNRMIAAASNPGDIVADPYAGCGTTAVAAAALGRRWFACEASPLGVNVMRQRLVECGASFKILRVDDAQVADRQHGRSVRPVGGLGKVVADYVQPWIKSANIEIYRTTRKIELRHFEILLLRQDRAAHNMAMPVLGVDLIQNWCAGDVPRGRKVYTPSVFGACGEHQEDQPSLSWTKRADPVRVVAYDIYGNRWQIDV